MSFIDDYNKRTRDNMYDSPTRSPYAKNLAEYTADVANPPAKGGLFSPPTSSPPVYYGGGSLPAVDPKQRQILRLGFWALFLLGPFAAIPALVVAAKNRPLARPGRIGVGLAICSLVLQAIAGVIVVNWVSSGKL